MSTEVNELLDLAKRACAVAAVPIRGGYDTVAHKGAVDLVTEVDLAAEAAIRAILEKETPEIPILAEEQGGAVHAETRWVVDPLDGTTNFVHGYPAYAVSIALQHQGSLVVGCVFDVAREQLWWGLHNGGSFCDGRKLAVSAVRSLEDSLVVTGFPAVDRQQRARHYLRFVEAFLCRSHGVRRGGAASLDLCLLADGRLDGYWEFGLNPWDTAAGALILQEAGGRITSLEGQPFSIDVPSLLASNGLIHDQMQGVIAELL